MRIWFLIMYKVTGKAGEFAGMLLEKGIMDSVVSITDKEEKEKKEVWFSINLKV